MSLLNRITEINNKIPNRNYSRLLVNQQEVGYVDSQIIDELPKNLFKYNRNTKQICADFKEQDRNSFELELNDFFYNYIASKGLISSWRNEKYAVRPSFDAKTLFLMERAALSYLGITGYGVHINGYVEKSDKIYMWISKRAKTKPTSPSKLDQIAAGGLPHDLSIIENIIKECYEEASIPKEIAEKAIFASTMSYWHDLPIGVRPDVIFNYDLKLPDNFVPTTNDDEVENFTLLSMSEILEELASTTNFKYNSGVVIIDFALRHGLLNQQQDFFDIKQSIENLYI